MTEATVFDIKEFGLHDGKGFRTTVFFKGCPLRCVWCHNPEGQRFESETVRNEERCRHCGLCRRPCAHAECAPFGVCVRVCPEDALRVAGERYTPQSLAGRLNKNRYFLQKGGVTFSGGEPLCQADFIAETVSLLKDLPTAVETCGCVPEENFQKALSCIDDFFMDLKLMDPAVHKRYTGADNGLILRNAQALLESGRQAVFRVPLIPGVTDTNENLSSVASFLAPHREHIRVELLPYNVLTGAKYKSVGRIYAPPFDEKQPLNKNTAVFAEQGISCVAY